MSITEETIRKQAESINRHNADEFAGYYGANAVVSDPAYPQPLKGRQEVEQDMADFLQAFPDLKIDLSRVLIEGDFYAVEGKMTATHTGPLKLPGGEVPATNKRVESGIGIFGTVDAEGKVVNERRYYDIAGQLAQLGLTQ